MGTEITAVRNEFPDLSDDHLLETLDTERRKFTRSDGEFMNLLILELIRRGVYPLRPQEGNPNSTHTMVEGYGAYWHLWRQPHECPHCKADLRDLKAGPPFKRQIGIEIGDNLSHYKCPDCGKDFGHV